MTAKLTDDKRKWILKQNLKTKKIERMREKLRKTFARTLVFANGLGGRISTQVKSYQRLKNGTWCRLPLHRCVVVIEMRAFSLPSTTVANFICNNFEPECARESALD